MLADVVRIPVGCVGVVVPSVAISRHVLLVRRPADVFLVEQVDNSGHVTGNVLQAISGQTPEVTTSGSKVIRFTWVGYAIVPSQGNTLRREVGEGWLRCCLGIVCVLQPNLDEAVEDLSGDNGGGSKGAV